MVMMHPPGLPGRLGVRSLSVPPLPQLPSGCQTPPGPLPRPRLWLPPSPCVLSWQGRALAAVSVRSGLCACVGLAVTAVRRCAIVSASDQTRPRESGQVSPCFAHVPLSRVSSSKAQASPSCVGVAWVRFAIAALQVASDCWCHPSRGTPLHSGTDPRHLQVALPLVALWRLVIASVWSCVSALHRPGRP